MIYDVRISEEAIEDLVEIQHYYVCKGRIVYAETLVTELIESTRSLTAFPERFSLLPLPDGRRSEDYRFYPLRRHKVVYWVDYVEQHATVVGFAPDAKALSLR